MIFVGVVILLAILAILAVQAVRLYYADADLTLLWMVKWGKKPDVFAGKVAIITGASSGIGEYLAYELAKHRCRLVLMARRSHELERVKQKCLESTCLDDGGVMTLSFDIKDQQQHAKAVDAILKHFGQIDILVNNAGRSQRAMIVDTDMAVYEDMMALNFLSAVSLTKAVLPHMIERQQGLVVAVSSAAGKAGSMNSASYSASKHAMQGWFNALRTEMYTSNIGVTIACPGPVHSEIIKHAYTGTTDKEYNGVIEPNEIRMATTRCATLLTVAMANRLEEVWISQHPTLISLYAFQYLPIYTIRYFGRMMSRSVELIKQGKHPLYSR